MQQGLCPVPTAPDKTAPTARNFSILEPSSQQPVGLREWGSSRLFLLRTPQHSERATVASTTLQLTRKDIHLASNGIEFNYTGHLWQIKDSSGMARLKQDGSRVHSAILRPGIELTIAGKSFIVESQRSIALRDICCRLLGWGADRAIVVDQALRAIRLASAGRAALVLNGSGDLVAVAHMLHRHTFDREMSFVVSDPHRRNAPATVRAPANHVCGMEAFRCAFRGTLCVRAERLPQDFADVLSAFRAPEQHTQLVICAPSAVAWATQIHIPSLATRPSEVSRIVGECTTDAIATLKAPEGCLNSRDLASIVNWSTRTRSVTISDIEKTAFRAVAVKITKDLAGAARLIGMTPIALRRWIDRRS
jgi:hypothetical protein